MLFLLLGQPVQRKDILPRMHTEKHGKKKLLIEIFTCHSVCFRGYQTNIGRVASALELFDGENVTATFIKQFQCATTTTCHAGERVLCHDNRQAGFFHQ